ncbi:hypothetical protein TNCV_4348971 [Trichonephila clavipes]|nr:hypothetical protein TNCV_4348971 [Trichonephila clavipes]
MSLTNPNVTFIQVHFPAKQHFKKYSKYNNLDGTENDYLLMNDSYSDGDDEKKFDDMPENILKDEYDYLLVLSNNSSLYSVSFLLDPNNISCELKGVKNGSQQREIRFFLQFFFDKEENVSQVTEIANGVYDADTVTANFMQFRFQVIVMLKMHLAQADSSSKMSIKSQK